MKKAFVTLAAGILMLVIGAAVFFAALSSPTVAGPAFMKTVWDIWMLAGIFLVGVSAGLAISKLIKKK